MILSPALWLYRLAWSPALALARFLHMLERARGKRLWPARWRLADRLGLDWPEAPPGSALWLHAASLGESKGLFALARELDGPGVSGVLTANTPEALEFLRAAIASLPDPTRWRAVIAPFDHPAVVREFLLHFRVRALVLFEVELWPHFILEPRRGGVPVLWVSARLTRRARLRYGCFPLASRALLRSLSWTLAQSEAEAALLRDRGCAAASAGPDLRGLHSLSGFDPAEREGRRFPWSERVGIAVVSLHADEIPALLPAFRSLPDGGPVYVFPRRMEELSRFVAALSPLGFVLHSRDARADRLIVDAFGLVPSHLDRCHIAVIGGSFAPHGGHNLWEGLVAGVALVTGPRHENQEYLVCKLEAANLLGIKNPLRAEDLRKSETDPWPACTVFCAQEKRALENAVAILREKISGA